MFEFTSCGTGSNFRLFARGSVVDRSTGALRTLLFT